MADSIYDYHCMTCNQVYLIHPHRMEVKGQPVEVLEMPQWLHMRMFPGRGATSRIACSPECAARYVKHEFDREIDYLRRQFEQKLEDARELFVSELDQLLGEVDGVFGPLRSRLDDGGGDGL